MKDGYGRQVPPWWAVNHFHAAARYGKAVRNYLLMVNDEATLTTVYGYPAVAMCIDEAAFCASLAFRHAQAAIHTLKT